MYIFPNDNFPSGNFPMKEKRHFPHEGSMKWTFKFYIFKRFFQLSYSLENFLKNFIQFLSVKLMQENVGGLPSSSKGRNA